MTLPGKRPVGKLQIPSSRLQRNSKIQIPNRQEPALELEVWSFPGVWSFQRVTSFVESPLEIILELRRRLAKRTGIVGYFSDERRKKYAESHFVR